MKFTVCTDSVLSNLPTAEAVKATAKYGYDVEFWSWWDKDMDAVAKASRETGVKIIAFCTKFVSLTDPAKRSEYLCGLKETLAACKKTDTKMIVSQIGNDNGRPRAEQRQSVIDGLKAAAPLLEKEKTVLVFEPLNLSDHPGSYLTSSAEAAAIADAVGSANVKILFDIYHQQITEGNIIRNCLKYIDKIGHIHCAGNPGRHELDKGEINYTEIFKALDVAGYNGYAGLEFWPSENASGVLNLSGLAQNFA